MKIRILALVLALCLPCLALAQEPLAVANGATLITCNNPDVVLDLLRKKGYHN